MTTPVSAIRLGKELDERLKNLCEGTDRNKAYYIRRSLKQYLDNIEGTYNGVRVAESWNNGGNKNIETFQTRDSFNNNMLPMNDVILDLAYKKGVCSKEYAKYLSKLCDAIEARGLRLDKKNG